LTHHELNHSIFVAFWLILVIADIKLLQHTLLNVNEI